MNSNPMYGRVEIVNLDSTLAKPNSVDAVLTFRNLHNWLGPEMDSIFRNSFMHLSLVVSLVLLSTEQNLVLI